MHDNSIYPSSWSFTAPENNTEKTGSAALFFAGIAALCMAQPVHTMSTH